ncbi:MAG: hypothetical protein ABIJ45_03670, partial [Candidatus Zixiibacteriota bacterium]
MKSPSLLMRLSHLIIVQIIFIFSAIALVVFWPDNDPEFGKVWSHKKNIVLNTANDLAKYLAAQSQGDKQELDMAKDINHFLAETGMVSHADLLSRDPESGQPVLKHLGCTIHDNSTLDNHGFLIFYEPLIQYFKTTDEPYLSLIAKNT